MLAALAPAAVICPAGHLILGVIVGAGLLWLLSGDDDETKAQPTAKPDEDTPPALKPATTARRVTREDMAEARASGA